MSKHWMLVGCLTGAATLAALSDSGQAGERPRQRIFSSAPAKSGTAKPAEDTRRKAEIDVELAWLADPVTFPYYLEAHLEGTTLTVRGYVPDKAVREHALKLARLHTPFTVADTIKEHPSLQVRIAKEPPSQLQSAVAATLREALPKQHKSVQVDCASDGTVTLRGPLPSSEEKLAASHALRRLYGCTSVKNLTQLPGMPEVAQTKPPPLPKDESKTSAPPVVSIGLPVPKEAEPVKTPPLPETPKTVGKLALTAEKTSRLEKRIVEACPGVKGVKIEVTAKNKLQIELTIRSDDQIPMFAGKIYSLPEVVDLRDDVELHFTVGK